MSKPGLGLADLEALDQGLDSPPSTGFGRAVPWSVVAIGGQQAVTALVGFVLAGIVGPKAFGTIAMAMVYVLFVQLLVRQGMIQAFIQRRELAPMHVDSGFWMVMGSSTLLGLLSVAVSGPWASANDLPGLQEVIIWLSPLVPLQGLSVVQEALLRRRMDFRGLATRSLGSAGIGGAIGIAMAVAGFGVWALVGQQLAMATANVVLLWHVSPWRPTLRFSTTHARELLGFSAGSSLGGVANFVNSRSDALLIGLLAGPVTVGLYRLAARFTEMVIDVFTRSIQQVALPELSRLHGQQERFRERTVSVVGLTSFVTLPMLGVLAGSSGALFDVFGDEWAPAALGLQILCVATAIRSVMLVGTAAVVAAGRPFAHAAFVWGSGAASGVAFVGVGLAVRGSSPTTQVAAIAVARLLVQVLMLIPFLRLLRSVAGVPWPSFVQASTGAALAASVAAAAALCVVELGPSGGPAVARLAASATAGLLAACAVLFVCERERARAVKHTIAAALRRERRGSVEPQVPTPSDAERPRLSAASTPAAAEVLPVSAGSHAFSRRRLAAGTLGLAVVMASLAATWNLSTQLEPTFKASASLVVLGPSAGLTPGGPVAADAPSRGRNPIADLAGDSWVHAAATYEAIDRTVDPEAAEAIDVGSREFEVSHSPGSVVVELGVAAPDPEDALAALDEVIQLARGDLDRRQDEVGAPSSRRLHVQVLERSSTAAKEMLPQKRILAIAFGLCIAALLACVATGARLRSAYLSRRRPDGERTPDLATRGRGGRRALSTRSALPGAGLMTNWSKG